MCDSFVRLADAMESLNWLEIIKTLASAGTAIIAFFALRNWQRQDKAKREAEFLDAMIEAVHAYIAEMRKPIMLLESAKIGMTSHVPTWESGEEGDKLIRGAIAYIQKNGEQDAKQLEGQLDAAGTLAIKLKAVATKGQVFNFRSYAKCRKAVAMLTWQFDRIKAFTVVIGSSSWNFENLEMRKRLKDVMAIEPDDIHKSLAEENVVILEFVCDTYKQIYG